MSSGTMGSAGAVVDAQTSLQPRPRASCKTAEKEAFKDAFVEMLHGHFSGPEEVAYIFGVTGQTGLNWWNGVCIPSGMQMARFLLNLPEVPRKHLRLVVNNVRPAVAVPEKTTWCA